MNEKQQRAFDDLARHIYGPLYTFDLSAKILEDKLCALGVSLPVRLYYEYRFPDNKNAEQFEHVIQKLELVSGFNSQQILNTSEYYQQESQKTKSRMQATGESEKLIGDVMDYIDQICKTCEQDCAGLTDAERTELVDYIVNMGSNVLHEMHVLASWLQQNNPELQSVRFDMTKYADLLMFLHGVNYGYAPADIDYFINTDMNTKISDTDEIYRQLESIDLYPNYIIRPDRAQKILDAALTARTNTQQG